MSIIYKKHDLNEVKFSYLVGYYNDLLACTYMYVSTCVPWHAWGSLRMTSGNRTWFIRFAGKHKLNLLTGPKVMSVNGNKDFCLGCFVSLFHMSVWVLLCFSERQGVPL